MGIPDTLLFACAFCAKGRDDQSSDLALPWFSSHPSDRPTRRETDIDRLADAVEQSLDLSLLGQWLPGLAPK